MSFSTEIQIHFDEADPAGIAFSGLLFTKMHRCFEEFIASLDIPPEDFFLAGDTIYPIRAVECEYLRPLLPFKKYPVQILVSDLGTSKFQITYKVMAGDELAAQLKSTHVCCKKNSMTKESLPENLRLKLESFASQR